LAVEPPCHDPCDPLDYQVAELEPVVFRDALEQASGLENVRIRGRTGAQGVFVWKDGKGFSMYAKSTVLTVGGRFHVVLVMGPDTISGRELVSRVARHAAQTYTPVP
jgi:hypothetical protein